MAGTKFRVAKTFTAPVEIVTGSTPKTRNPCVVVPATVATALKSEARKNQSLPVTAALAGRSFRVNVVRYRGAWRLYLNGPMLKRTGLKLGDRVKVTLRHDPNPRVTPMPPAFARALAKDARAKAAFGALAPSRRKEVLRYLGNLKREETLTRNVQKVLGYLNGTGRGAVPVWLHYHKK